MNALAPLTAARAVSSWQLDVPALVVVALLGGAYLAGVRAVRRRDGSWPAWRAAVFLLPGLGCIVLTTMSFFAVYDRALFWPRAVQYTVMIGVVPLMLAVGEPIELARRCLTGRGARRLSTVLSWRPVRVLALPLVGAVLGVAVLMVVYFTPLYRVALTSQAVHQFVMLALLVTGLLFFVPELDPDSGVLPQWCGPSLRLVFALLDGLVDALPGVVIMTMHGVIGHGYYAALGRDWGPSPKWDQTIGGGLMFTISELVALPFVVLLFLQWIRSDEQQARETDRRLDAVTAQEHAGSVTATGGTEPAGESTRPWWETDPGPLAERNLRRPH